MSLTPEQILKIQLVEYKEQDYASIRCAKALANVLTMFQDLQARLAACEKKSDEEMLRVKACEHIAEGEPEWEKFREICPSTMAVASLQDRLAQAEARVQALEARLEIDHAYDQDMQRIEIPVEQRDKFPDGIACRDATIQLQDERVKELEQENARLKAELEQHGAGKCCTMGKTYTRPEFHIDPDDY